MDSTVDWNFPDSNARHLAHEIESTISARIPVRETDEERAEAHEYFHFHQTRGRGGHCRIRQG